MPKSSVDPVAQLAEIQGPVRHAWWSFWSAVEGAAFRLSFRWGGRCSLARVVGEIAAWLRQLERLTR